MAKINDITEGRILAAAKITDILDDMGVTLHRQGANLTALCPFHDDRNLGSFIISETKNICTCYACGAGTMNPKTLLAKWKGWDLQKDYPKVLRYLAAKYGIYVDDEPVPQVKKAEPRPEPKRLPMVYWPITIVKSSLHHNDINPLMQFLASVPMSDEDRKRFNYMSELYLVGTSTKGWTQGFTIWWQVDENNRVRTGKLMAYKNDGHRDKERKHSFAWVHSLLEKAGQFDPSQYDTVKCLFGLHLMKAFPNAEICLVESEKSALICSAFTDPNERLWMATAGKSGLSREKLQPLMDANRYIVLFPDKDGYDEWKAQADMLHYPRLSVSRKVNELWLTQDGDKADIADIMLRRLQGITETDKDKAFRMLGIEDAHHPLGDLIDKLNLQIIQ